MYGDKMKKRNALRDKEIVSLKKAGHTIKKIGEMFNISHQRVDQITKGIRPDVKRNHIKIKETIEQYPEKNASEIGRMLNVSIGKVIYIRNKHFSNWKKELSIARFWKKTNKVDGCWEWAGYKSPTGYGVTCHDGKNISTHRLAWKLHNKKDPGKKHVLHTCDNKKCINPDHLYLGTHQDNMKDRSARKPTNKRRFNDQEVGEMRKEYKELGVNISEMTQKYGTSYTVMHNLITGNTY